MKNRAPIQDKIDLRNFRNELKNSVVKRSRVHFVTSEEEDENQTVEMNPVSEVHPALKESQEDKLDLSGVSQEDLARADEILARLQREAEEDERAKKEEWERKWAEENPDYSEFFNEATNSYSGMYGQGEIDEESRKLAESIMSREGGVRQPMIPASEEALELLTDESRNEE